jgi:hypothetical protein
MGGEASSQIVKCISVVRERAGLVVGLGEREVRSGVIGLVLRWLLWAMGTVCIGPIGSHTPQVTLCDYACRCIVRRVTREMICLVESEGRRGVRPVDFTRRWPTYGCGYRMR